MTFIKIWFIFKHKPSEYLDNNYMSYDWTSPFIPRTGEIVDLGELIRAKSYEYWESLPDDKQRYLDDGVFYVDEVMWHNMNAVWMTIREYSEPED